MGARGIALAVSLSAIFQVILLYGLWNKRSENKESHTVYFFYIKIIVISMVIGVFLEWFKGLNQKYSMALIPGHLQAAYLFWQ